MATKRPTPRAEWGSLTREAVIDTALEMLRADGIAALSIRGVASRLDVSPMALYRHVASKDDLLDEVVDRLFEHRWRPTISTRDWQRWIIDAADRLRQFLVDQPAALHVYLRHPVVAPTAALRMDTCLAVLGRAITDYALAHRAYAAIQTYTIGFAALEAARESSTDHETGPRRTAENARDAERVRELAPYASPTQFRAGLNYLLHGILA